MQNTETNNLYNVTIYVEQVTKKTFWNRNPRKFIHRLTEQVIIAKDQEEADKKTQQIVQRYIDKDPELFSTLVVKPFAIKVKSWI